MKTQRFNKTLSNYSMIFAINYPESKVYHKKYELELSKV